jgi:hypothetical protein
MALTNYIIIGTNLAVVTFVNTKAGQTIIKNPKIRLFITVGGLATSAFFTYKESKNIEQYFKNKKYHKELTPGSNTTGTGTTTGTDGQPKQVDLKTIAAKIHSCFYDNDWFGATEDEIGAIKALLQVRPEDASRLSDIYNELYQKILKEDFIKYLSDLQSTSIESYLSAM